MNLLIAWLLMLALHASVLLFIAWSIDTCLRSLRETWRELLWRAALFGGLLTATIQSIGPPQSFIGRWHWAASAISIPQEAPGADTRAISTPAVARPGAAAATHAAPPAGRTVIQTPVAFASENLPARAPFTDAARLLVGLWLLGLLLASLRLLGNLRRLRHELGQAASVLRRDVLDDLAALAARAGLAPPKLLQLDGLPSPIAVTGTRIVLPSWSLQTLNRAQLRAMLAHELGHIARRDPHWKLLGASWRAVLWFLPPAATAQRRLDEIAELACDAFAARHTGDARSLAECLATCAEYHLQGDRGAADIFDFAPAMASRRSSLLQRIERLLDGASMEAAGSGLPARAIAALALTAAVFCLPAIGFRSARVQAATPSAKAGDAAKQSSSHSSVSVHSDDDGSDTMTVSLSDDAHKFTAKVNGKIAFNDDDTDVAGISGIGTATLEETIGGVSRRLELAQRNGKLERRYFVDGNERPLDEPARQWVGSVVLQLVRSGIGAEERVARLYAKGGAARVLDEIAQIPGDYVRGIYLRALMGLGKLTPAELERATKLAGGMQSDYERRRALTAEFDTQALDPQAQVTFLRQALRFDSDYERAELLIGVESRLANTDAVRQAWLDAALKVTSDYERGRTLKTFLGRAGVTDAQLASIIDASASIKSDYEHREVLVAAARQAHDAEAIAPAYTRSAQSLGSDYERREALLALIRSGHFGTRGATAVLDSAAQIKSDYERREVLVALARVMPADAGLLDRYRQVASSLGAYEREQAERALVR